MNQQLNKLFGQLRLIWQQLEPAQRLTMVTVTFALLAGLAAIGFWTSRTDYGLLYGKLPESESAKVVAALDDAKIPYKVGTGGAIYVASDKVYMARMQLAGKGIPKGDGVGFEIFDKPNFGISDFVQRANYVRAVQGELSRTISQLDEIESARVMIVLPENRLLLDRDKHPTASVFVHTRGNAMLQPQSVNSIRFLVANAVEGLKPNFVSIVDSQGNLLSENNDSDSLVGLSTTQLAARRNLEQYLSKKAEGLLEQVLGPRQAIVRVSADINFDTVTRQEERYDPDGQVVKSQTKDDETTDTVATSSSQPSGVVPNTATESNAVANASAPVSTSKNKKTNGTTEYEISKTVSNIVYAAGGIRRISAAVTIAARTEGTGAARKVVARTPAELEKLRRIVQSALGIQTTDKTRADEITLEELSFNNEFSTEITRQLEQQQTHEFWLNLALKAVYPVLGIGILLVFLRIFKRTPVEEVAFQTHGRRGAAQSNGNGNGHGQADWHRQSPPGIVTVDVLNQLVKENPANMTQALRTWLARGKSN